MSRTTKREICVGIDLGTSSSCCSYLDPNTKQLRVLTIGSKSTIPSIVHYPPDGKGEILVGEQAQQRGPSFPKSTIFGSKRLIGLNESGMENKRILKDLSYGPFDLGLTSKGDVGFHISPDDTKKIITPTDVATDILKYFKKQVELQDNVIVTEVVLTVPAYFTPDQRSQTSKAAAQANLRLLRLIPEPTAAAFAFVHQTRTNGQTTSLTGNNEPDYLLVYDFGGGTLDCSLVRQTYNTNGTTESDLQVLATAGDPLLGGADLDNDLMKWVVKQLSTHFNIDTSYFLSDANKTRRLRQTCRTAKEALSQSISVDLDLDDFYQREPFTLKLTRPLFQNICKETLKRAFVPIKQVLQDANIDKSKINDVVLVGGSSRIPIIQEQLKKFFGFKDISQLSRTVNPDECVAKGAALFAATLTTYQYQQLLTKFANCVNSFPLTLYTHYGPSKRFYTLIEQNEPLPKRGQTDICLDRTLLHNLDPPSLRIALFQAPLTDTTSTQVDEQFQQLKARLFKKWTLPLECAINFGDQRPYVITVHYQVDADGILDIFFEDKEMNLIIDVSMNKSTTDTVVQEALVTQHKEEVLERYQNVQQHQQQRLPIPPAPTTTIHGGSNDNNNVPFVLPHLQNQKPKIQPPQPPQQPPQQPKVDEPQQQEQSPPQQQQPPPPPVRTGPPPIPAHVNTKIIEQLQSVVAVRDEMIMQLQQQILSMKLQIDTDQNEIHALMNDYHVLKVECDNEITLLRKKCEHLEQDKLLLIQQQQSQQQPEQSTTTPQIDPIIVQQLQHQLEDKEIENNTIREQLTTIEGQYASLYDHYDALHLENETNKSQLESTSLSLKEMISKTEHYKTIAEQARQQQMKAESLASELNVGLAECSTQLQDFHGQLLESKTEIIMLKEELEHTKEQLLIAQSNAKDNTPPPIVFTPQQQPLERSQSISNTMPKLPPPFDPSKYTNNNGTNITTIEEEEQEQSDRFMASLPPLPPISNNIFSEPITPQQRHLPPPRIQKRPTLSSIPLPPTPTSPQPSITIPPIPPQQQQQDIIIPQEQQQSLSSSTTSIQDDSIPPELLRPSTLPPIAPKAPQPPEGHASRSFLLDIMKKPQLKKVEQNPPASSSTTTTTDNSNGSASDQMQTTTMNTNDIPTTRPRVTLLSQLQQGQKLLKKVDENETAKAQQPPPPQKGLLDADLMAKIANFRKQVAADDDEEEHDDDDW